MTEKKRFGADLVLESLINHDVNYIFGIPGAKIDRLFEAIEYTAGAPKLVITKHEQNAAFMAQAVGRLTGKPGVMLVTSGPGASNLATGILTAQTENDPVVAIAGQVQRQDLYRRTHQSTPSVLLFNGITKFTTEVQDAENLSEVIANAFDIASKAPQGAAFISLPQDVDDSPVHSHALAKVTEVLTGPADLDEIKSLAEKINHAKLPVILVGQRGSDENSVASLHKLLHTTKLPVVETFQGAGVIDRSLVEQSFFGRVGLFANQTGDQLLRASDLVIALGYDAVEYEPRVWNKDNQLQIMTIDSTGAQIDAHYNPTLQLVGNISATLDLLGQELKDYRLPLEANTRLDQFRKQLASEPGGPKFTAAAGLSHPLDVIHAIQKQVTDDMTVTLDVGSVYIWMSRFFRSYRPRHFLISDGMQTLGVALPWAIAAGLVRPEEKIVSVSGDGGFMFSSAELETAVRLKSNLVHLIFNDRGHYDMVKFQEEMKYGRSAGVDFGEIDFIKFAESFGVKAFRVDDPEKIDAVLTKAFNWNQGPVLVDIPVDYSHNTELYADLIKGATD
ncbi:acetolactate synthase AlsS [Oenococcus sicerae]|uniref:Acetolactate synthase AlsS n=1 Tax=Oenococcus sicerae TaxID=2203724 RepID=A0AAJ1VNQ1_9LACO|nr:acetolactate synthase AlsS [Oenococcus sicerae]MDN6900454.1 acetolactate synthase AlsS [Oenococcus sicerae]